MFSAVEALGQTIDAGSGNDGGDENSRGHNLLPKADAETLLEVRPDAAPGRGEKFYDKNFEKSVPMFGSDWRFAFGGFVKVDLIQDFSGTGDEFEFTLASIPVDGSPPPGSYSHLQMAETRFNFEVRNMASGSAHDRFFLEFDFFNKESNLTPRLRHAYFEYGRILAGRTWTLLTELRQLPVFLDFASGDAIFGGRTDQIRWRSDPSKGLDWAIALEDYNDSAIFNPSDLQGTARSNTPRLSGGLSLPWSNGVVSFGAAVNQVRFDGTGPVGSVSEIGWSATAGGRVYLDKATRSYFGFGYSLVDGNVTDILVYANGRTPNAALTAQGELELASGWNAHVALHWEFTDKWSTNFDVAFTDLSVIPGDFANDITSSGYAVHANVIYDYNGRLRAGVEFMHGKREIVGGSDGDAQRLQFSLFYFF